jgi:hypothetical protein
VRQAVGKRLQLGDGLLQFRRPFLDAPLELGRMSPELFLGLLQQRDIPRDLGRPTMWPSRSRIGEIVSET